MIEKGLVPPAELSPGGPACPASMTGVSPGSVRPSRVATRFRSAGVMLVGLGVALALLIGVTAGKPQRGPRGRRRHRGNRRRHDRQRRAHGQGALGGNEIVATTAAGVSGSGCEVLANRSPEPEPRIRRRESKKSNLNPVRSPADAGSCLPRIRTQCRLIRLKPDPTYDVPGGRDGGQTFSAARYCSVLGICCSAFGASSSMK